MHGISAKLVRRLYPHNPAYIISAWLVLHGLRLAFDGEGGALLTSLLCGYILALVGVGVLVVRCGKLWEDARTVLLVVLLMFTALSVSYDELCQRDPVRGAWNLGFGLLFSCVTTEVVLRLLSIRLPFAFRLPLYAQLAVLFAFPAWLGRMSIEGHDQMVSLGVVGYSVAAGLSLLLLLPAAHLRPARLQNNGTPWRWPLYPWSIFVFMALALGVRAWMLSFSFSQGLSVRAGFHPMLLCPILLAVAVVVLELGIVHGSRVSQRIAFALVAATVLLGTLDPHLNPAQEKLVLAVGAVATGPAVVLAVAGAVVCGYGMLRRACWAEPAAIALITLALSLPADAFCIQQAEPLSQAGLMTLAAWMLLSGAWRLDLLRVSLGGTAASVLAASTIEVAWVDEHLAFVAVHAAWAWLAATPLVCQDKLAKWLRLASPPLTLAAVGWSLLASPAVWRDVPAWHAPLLATMACVVGLLYWARTRMRWCVASTLSATAITVIGWAYFLLNQLGNEQLRDGMRWYAAGCVLMLIGLLVSMAKAGYIGAWLKWLDETKQIAPGQRPGARW